MKTLDKTHTVGVYQMNYIYLNENFERMITFSGRTQIVAVDCVLYFSCYLEATHHHSDSMFSVNYNQLCLCLIPG